MTTPQKICKSLLNCESLFNCNTLNEDSIWVIFLCWITLAEQWLPPQTTHSTYKSITYFKLTGIHFQPMWQISTLALCQWIFKKFIKMWDLKSMFSTITEKTKGFFNGWKMTFSDVSKQAHLVQNLHHGPFYFNGEERTVSAKWTDAKCVILHLTLLLHYCQWDR